jgi:hypothetical protein
MDPLDDLLRRPKLYGNVEGAGELGIGFMMLAFALLQWMQLHTPRNSVWNQMYTLFIFFGLVVLIIQFGTKAIKERITYPRTGYVECRTQNKFPLMLFTFVLAVTSAVMYVCIRQHWNLTTPPALLGLVFAASYAFGFARTARWKWLVVWVEVAGSVVIALLPAHVLGALAEHSFLTTNFPASVLGAALLSFILYGTLLLISGSISFWLYLQHTK